MQSKGKVLIVLSGTATDKIMLLRLADGEVTKIAEYELDKKIQRVALDANLHHGKVQSTPESTEF